MDVRLVPWCVVMMMKDHRNWGAEGNVEGSVVLVKWGLVLS